LLLGGGLITAANIALTLAPPPPEHVAPAPPAPVRVAAEAAAGDAARG
jgi:hypothetical protein